MGDSARRGRLVTFKRTKVIRSHVGVDRLMKELAPVGRARFEGKDERVWLWETQAHRPMVIVTQAGPRRYEVYEVMGDKPRSTTPLIERFTIISAEEARQHQSLKTLMALK